MATINIQLDSGPVRLRAVRPEDAPALEEAFQRLSERSRYLRFFSGMPKLSTVQLTRFTDVDQHHHIAIGAADPTLEGRLHPEDGLAIGVGRYTPTDVDRVAELAITVTDDHQGRGVGRLLLVALLVVAESKSLDALVATTLSENMAMRGLLTSFGAEVAPDDGDFATTAYRLDITEALSIVDPELRRSLVGLLPWP